MNLINVLSLILFLIFLISYTVKLIILYKKSGIHANLLAKGNKGDLIDFTETLVKIFSFIWGIVWFSESIASVQIHLLFKEFFHTGYIGLVITTIGLFFFILAMISMKTSWRVGIDKETTSKLITNGLYRYSRNPAFVGFYLMFIGLFFTFPNILTLATAAINIFSIHKLILQEEQHLQTVFDKEYIDYKKTTPRYLFF